MSFVVYTRFVAQFRRMHHQITDPQRWCAIDAVVYSSAAVLSHFEQFSWSVCNLCNCLHKFNSSYLSASTDLSLTMCNLMYFLMLLLLRLIITYHHHYYRFTDIVNSELVLTSTGCECVIRSVCDIWLTMDVNLLHECDTHSFAMHAWQADCCVSGAVV